MSCCCRSALFRPLKWLVPGHRLVFSRFAPSLGGLQCMSLEHDNDLSSTRQEPLHDDGGLKLAPEKSKPLETQNYLPFRRTYRRSRATNSSFITRLGTFLVALAAAFLVFLVKRYELDEVLVRVLGAEDHLQVYRTGAPSRTGHLSRDYAICTRTKGGIYTLEERGNDPEWAERTQCLVVDKHGTIAATGSIDEIKTTHPQLRPRFLPSGSTVVPGLVDSHVHLMEYGWSRSLNLEGTKSVDEVVQRVRDYILARPLVHDEEWIEGVGWDQNLWENWPGGFPTHDILDADPVLRGKPIILFRIDLHAMWINGRALELCGKLPDKAEGGEIIRNGATGKPTGVFLDNAQLLVPRPQWSQAQMREFVQKGFKDVLKYGVTAVHDAMTRDIAVKFYRMLADQGELPIRMHLMGYMDVGYWNGTERFDHYGPHQRLHLRSIKMVADGAIGSWGAAMYEPYTDNPSTSGFFVVSEQDLKDFIPRYLEEGWQVNVHCIGDRANGEVLDIMESALRGHNAHKVRLRIEHAQILRPNDILRMAKLGIIASVQPKQATSDMVYADARLGERVKSAYAYQTLLKTGARIALGSDMPVESPNPLVTFHAAIARVNATGGSPHGPDGWYPDEKLTRMQALRGMTTDAAYASFSENEVGELVPGKKADFVVLDRDIMTVDAQDILQTNVLATVVDGAVQYGAL